MFSGAHPHGPRGGCRTPENSYNRLADSQAGTRGRLMLHATGPRFLLAFLAAFFVASNLNWAVAEFLLNPWAIPRLGGFMRMDAGGADIARMTLGFAVPQLVAVTLVATLPRPRGWVARALWAGWLVGLGGFFGTYTFISGWGNVPWWPLMVTAACDTVTLMVGALLAALIMSRGRQGVVRG